MYDLKQARNWLIILSLVVLGGTLLHEQNYETTTIPSLTATLGKASEAFTSRPAEASPVDRQPNSTVVSGQMRTGGIHQPASSAALP